MILGGIGLPVLVNDTVFLGLEGALCRVLYAYIRWLVPDLCRRLSCRHCDMSNHLRSGSLDKLGRTIDCGAEVLMLTKGPDKRYCASREDLDPKR